MSNTVMSNTVRTFRAATADEALAQVRREMGVDAVVVEVKQVSAGGLFGWLSSHQMFEVTASRPVAAKRTATAQRTARSSTTQSHPAQSVQTQSHHTQSHPIQSRPMTPSTVGTIAAAAAKSSAAPGARSAAASAIGRHTLPETSRAQSDRPGLDRHLTVEISNTAKRAAAHGDAARSDGLAPPPPLLPEGQMPRNRVEESLDRGRTSQPSHFETTRGLVADIVRSLPTTDQRPTEQRSSDQRAESPRGMTVIAGRLPAAANDSVTQPSIEQRLDALQHMIADLGQRTQPRGLVDIPPELFPHYLTLVEADVAEEIARELLRKLQRHASPGQLADTAATMALLTALLEPQIICSDALTLLAGRRQIAMVVGPTGVGKTTTLAKLAGRFGVQEGCQLGLITVDTYRVAAVEQLKTYAEIIDLPMRIVSSAAEMQDALDSFANCDLVLIDTAGRSPHDDRKLAELKQLVEIARPDHVYLVLSLASGANVLRTAAERFASIHPTSLVFTKLDEAIGCGGLLSATRDIGLPIAYFTTGQEVPRDIEPANPCRAARLILGTDHLDR